MPRKSTQKQLEPPEASVRLQARVARMFDLEKQIEGLDKVLRWPHYEGSQRVVGLKALLGKASREMQEARKKHTAAKSEFEKQLAVRQRGDDVDKAKAACETAKREFEQAEERRLRLKEKDDGIRVELDSANQELKELKRDCGIPEVLDFQQVLATAQQRVAELKAHVAEQERVIEEAKASVPSAAELLKRREDIGADLLTGQATEADLKAVNEELQALHQTIDAASVRCAEVLAKTEPDLAGLRRKLEETEQELQNLNCQKTEMARLFLKAQASVVYADYLNLGEQLGEKFVKLMSLNALICSVPERRHIDHSILLMASVMKIPRFKIGPDSEAPSMSTVFAAAEQRIDLAREAERERLKAEGFILLD